MNRLLYIARFEYIRQISRRSFLVLLFGMPLILVGLVGVVTGIMVVLLMMQQNERAIGYVDHAGVLRQDVIDRLVADPDKDLIPLVPYADEATAHRALQAGAIDAYVVLPADYLKTGEATAYGQQRISMEGKQTLRSLIRMSMLADETPSRAKRAYLPLAALEYRRIEAGEPGVGALPPPTPLHGEPGETGGNGIAPPPPDDTAGVRQRPWFLPLIVVFAMMFVGTIFSSSSYLLHALIDEKENRTMEIVITSVSPEQLIGGKTLGLGLIGLTQLLIWLVYSLLPMGIGAVFVHSLQTFLATLLGDILPIALLFLVPSYLLYAGLIVTVGAMVSSLQEGQQLASFFLLPTILPLMFFESIQAAPHGSLAVALSMVPITAPLAMLLRVSFAPVPLWQIGLSLTILLLSVVLVIIGSARIFRLGMLRYGKSIKLRELIRMLR